MAAPEPAFEKLLLTPYTGLQTCIVFPAPTKGLLENTVKHYALSGFFGPLMQEVGLSTLQLLYQSVPETRKILPYKPDTASSFSRLLDMRRRPHPLCTRTLLERILADLALSGLTFLVGVEVEFQLFNLDGSSTGAGLQYSWLVAAPGHPVAAFLEDCTRALQAIGVPILKFHTETAANKVEFALRPLPPQQAADAVLRVKEVVKDLSIKHKLQATFSPIVPTADGRRRNTGSIHYHISIGGQHNDPLPEDAEYIMSGLLSDQERSFAAGLLAHMPSLLGISMPHALSFERKHFCGHVVRWGSDLHFAPLRLVWDIDDEQRPKYRFEYRGADAVADPHLTLAAILSVGGDAIKRKKPLLLEDAADPKGRDQMDFETVTPAEAKARGQEMLPESLEEALAALEADQDLHRLLGEQVVKTHIGVRRGQAKLFNAKTKVEQYEYLVKML